MSTALRAPLDELLERMRESEDRARGVGVLTAGVIAVQGFAAHHATTLAEVSAALEGAVVRRARSDDLACGPLPGGHRVVLLLAEPRSGRALGPGDLARASERLRQAVFREVARLAPRHAGRPWECFVGGTVARRSPGIPARRALFLALDEALADGLRQNERRIRHESAGARGQIERVALRVVYQPVVDARARCVVGVEALARIGDDRSAGPAQLFRRAREYGNGELCRLERSCRSRAIVAAPRLAAHQLLFVNIEPESLNDPELLDGSFLTELAGAGIAPERVVLDIAAHRALGDFEWLRDSIKACRRRGLRIALDSAGSEQAGLRAVSEGLADFVKLDLALVRDLHLRRTQREWIEAYREAAEPAGITLIAEGVESVAELRALRALGVQWVQGYLFARPSARPSAPNWGVIRAVS